MIQAGLFGGSFDPPHLAHRALAEAALEQLGLHEVRWMPAGQPWQKAGQRLAPGRDRLEMLRLLRADEARFRLDARELRRSGASYTVDSLRELDAEQPDHRWWLVIGQDQYARLSSWHLWPEILSRAALAVAARDGEPVRPDPALAAVPHELRVLRLPPLPHAASTVRSLVAAGRPIDALVGEPVARYIARHHLYQGPASAP